MTLTRLGVLALLALTAPLTAQPVRFRTVSSDRGRVSVGSIGDTVWLSLMPVNGDIFTIRADSQTMAAWADSPTLFNDQAIAFVPLPGDSTAYFVRGVQGARRDSVQLSGDSARAVFAAMRGEVPSYTPPQHAYLKFQVQRQANFIRDTHFPVYPESYRFSLPGNVLARFVVDGTGRVDARSIAILFSTNKAFGDAVRDGVKQSRFEPAQIDGRPVAEIVDVRFYFHPPSQLLVINDAMDRLLLLPPSGSP